MFLLLVVLTTPLWQKSFQSVDDYFLKIKIFSSSSELVLVAYRIMLFPLKRKHACSLGVSQYMDSSTLGFWSQHGRMLRQLTPYIHDEFNNSKLPLFICLGWNKDFNAVDARMVAGCIRPLEVIPFKTVANGDYIDQNFSWKGSIIYKKTWNEPLTLTAEQLWDDWQMNEWIKHIHSVHCAECKLISLTFYNQQSW